MPVMREIASRRADINYASLGTFEFLLSPQTGEFFFLEINPRLQVEHTITESICAIDIVKAQLQLAQGAPFAEAGLDRLSQDPLQAPDLHSIQLRITAEDPEKSYSLSIGKIQSFRFPAGNGIRVDTALINGAPAVVSSDFDSVIAKLIITAPTSQDVISKATRALEDTSVVGINTNITLLRAIVDHPDFEAGVCDTRWLEAKHEELLERSRTFAKRRDPFHGLSASQQTDSTSAAASSSSMMFRKDDAWSIALAPQSASTTTTTRPHHLQLSKIIRNDFPTNFTADVLFTAPGASPQGYRMDVQSTSTSASATSSQHEQGSRANSNHVILPISGKLVEVLVDVGDVVKKDDPICVIKQMKMEIEIRSHKAGLVTWLTEADDDEDVAEGMLAAVIEDEKAQAKL
ncbi:hypothetical protein LTR53_001332 [Teratosphaeriaceae sp. CCFEE 6253]|nr:hypothetical protein LTR53_001332 [Teratosphaeriaceae sp. CCFEE 6253]